MIYKKIKNIGLSVLDQSKYTSCLFCLFFSARKLGWSQSLNNIVAPFEIR